jgi:hypothetical protein
MAQNGAYRNIGGVQYLLKPRDYAVQIVHSGVAGSTAFNFINVDPSSPFLLKILDAFDTNDPTTTSPGLNGQYENAVMVVDNSNNYQWENIFVPRSTFCGSREWPYRLPDEVLINANTKLTVNIQEPLTGNLAGTTTITLKGYSLYSVTGS